MIMEQSTSQPSNLFIPQPIERRLTAYQLGTLLEVYQRGWRRGSKGDRRPSKFLPLLFAIGGTAGFIASIIALLGIVQSTNLIASTLVLIPLVPAFFAMIGIATLCFPSLCVGAFSEGIAYAKGTRVKVLRWYEIESYKQETVKSWYGLLYCVFTIHASNSKSLKFKIFALQGEKLGKVIQENLTR
jgi:hypothetical protein